MAEAQPREGAGDGASGRPAVKAEADGGDAVVARIPVYLRPPADHTRLYLFQYPLRPRWRPYSLEGCEAARVRPEQQQVELTLEAEYEDEEGATPSPIQRATLASTHAIRQSSYAIGTLRADAAGEPSALVLAPLACTVQLRPSFAKLDEAEQAKEPPPSERRGVSAAGSDAGADDADEGPDAGSAAEAGGGVAASSLAPLLRPAQTEREMEARLSSHAYLIEQREAEPWCKATLSLPGSRASQETHRACFEVH
jgi:hypothetical protein